MDKFVGTWITDEEKDKTKYAEFFKLAKLDEEWQEKMKNNEGMKMIFACEGDKWTCDLKTKDDQMIRANTFILDKEVDMKTADGRDAKATVVYKDNKFYVTCKINGIEDEFVTIYELKGDNKLSSVFSVPSKNYDGPTMTFTKE